MRSTLYLQNYRLDFSGQSEVSSTQSTLLSDNHSLSFSPTVCVVRYLGQSKLLATSSSGSASVSNSHSSSGTGSVSGSGSVTAAPSTISENDKSFQTEFTNWLDADFWTDLGPEGSSTFQGETNIESRNKDAI